MIWLEAKWPKIASRFLKDKHVGHWLLELARTRRAETLIGTRPAISFREQCQNFKE